jgi:hypothetical protein
VAHYLLRIPDVPLADQFQIIEADSARAAVDKQDVKEGTVDVWTLRSGEPRIYEVSTESVRTVRRVE